MNIFIFCQDVGTSRGMAASVPGAMEGGVVVAGVRHCRVGTTMTVEDKVNRATARSPPGIRQQPPNKYMSGLLVSNGGTTEHSHFHRPPST